MFHHPVWPKKVNVFCTELGNCGDRKEVCVTNVDLTAKGRTLILGPRHNQLWLTHSVLFQQFWAIVLGLDEMKTMGCISGCWESLKCEVNLGFNPSETLKSQGRSVPVPQPFHMYISGLECSLSLPTLGLIIRALYQYLDSFPCRHTVTLHLLIHLTMELWAWSLIWSMKYKWMQCWSLQAEAMRTSA